MNDLESRISDTLRRHEGDAPAFDPSDARRTAGRTRRRQILNATGAGIGALAVVVGLAAGLGGLVRAERTPTPLATPPPPPADAPTTLLEDFLQARIEGEGAQGYVDVIEWTPTGGVPLLYATTTGAPYERFEFEPVDGPYPRLGSGTRGGRLFKVRLFAESGDTVVEQLFHINSETGRIEYWPNMHGDFAPTTENGQPVAVPYRFFDGEVTLHVARPWVESGIEDGLFLDHDREQRIVVMGDPLPVETGCEQGPAPADADALARSIRSDPDLQATAPVAVSIGGVDALQMDVTTAPGASVCEAVPAPEVLTEDDDSWPGIALKHGQRMRLYLLDLPGGSARILAIAIVAPEPDFERVMEAAAPIVGSVEFRTG